MLDYNLAQDIAICVLNKMNGSRVPTLTEMYPGLFEELEQHEEESSKPQAWELYKEQMLDFANLHNKKRQKEG